MARMEKNKEIFGLPLMFWGLWVTLLILWMGRFVTSFLSMYLVSDMHVSAGVAGTIVSMYGFAASSAACMAARCPTASAARR